MKTLQTFFLLLLTVLLITGCAKSKDFGKLARNDEVKKTFEAAAVVPDHTYYYTGPEAKPDAIMAIHNNYTLTNGKNFWIKVDITEKVLQDWNMIIDNNSRTRYPYRGARIMTPGGEQVGIWYSKYIYTTVKFPAPNTVVVYTPELSPKNPLEPNPFTLRF